MICKRNYNDNSKPFQSLAIIISTYPNQFLMNVGKNIMLQSFCDFTMGIILTEHILFPQGLNLSHAFRYFQKPTYET